MAKPLSKAVRDRRANQLNRAHPAYYLSRGLSADEAQFLATHAQPALDNHADQLNPNSDAYWRSRGVNGRPASPSNASSAKPE